MKGTIVRVVEDRGFLFISPGGGEKDVFAHVRDLPIEWPFDATLEGRVVEFDKVDGAKGPQARNVRARL